MSIATTSEIRVPSAATADSLDCAVEVSDHDLMIAVRAGEIARLGELFERYNRRLYAFFVRLTNQPSASEDLVQVVFYRILKYRHTYRDEGKFSAWIYHLARKVSADHYRKHSSLPQPADPVALQEHPDHDPSPDDQASSNDDLALLRQALARLPVEHREVLVLSRLQKIEHREIAQLLDCSVGAVKVRVHRALKELRDVYFKMRKGQTA
ncbi:MAG TPA: sigma-70 family RNA polymerase sigma factor [Candidatus Didemnitutus sp.]|nr:sigma-70 family RNA polymerase sigma factor [Candidatus Didemnitutus sp.]